MRHRFETVFYLVGVNDQPNIKAINNEVDQSLVIHSQLTIRMNSFNETVFHLILVGNTISIA